MCATTRMRLRASLHWVFSTLMCYLKERCKSHPSPRNFVDSSTGRSVSPIVIVGGLVALYQGAVKCTTLHLWAANLKPFLVAHSCMEFTNWCRCLSMVSRERPQKTDSQVIDKECSEDVHGNMRGQLINLYSKACNSQDTTSWYSFFWIKFIWECSPNADSNSALPEILTKTGSLPLRPILCRSRMIPYCHVVP